MVRRRWLEVVAIAVVALAGALAITGGAVIRGDLVGATPLLGWRAWRIGQTWGRVAAKAADLDPVAATAWALHGVGLARAEALAVTGWLAVGLFAAYASARWLGAGRASALGGAAIAGVAPPLLDAAARGDGRALGLAPISLGLAGMVAGGRAGVLVAGVAGAWSGAWSLAAGIGLVTAGAIAAGRKGLGAAVATAIAVGIGAGLTGARGLGTASLAGLVGAGETRAVLGPVVVLAVAIGLVATRHRDGVPRRLALGALAALFLALGPVLRTGGRVVAVSGRAVPLPAVLVEAVTGPLGWWASLIPAAAAAGLAVARLGRWGWLLGLAALGQAFVVPGLPLPTSPGRLPRAVRALAAGEGAVLDLPVEVAGDPEAAPAGTAVTWRWWQVFHHREAVAGQPLGATSQLLAEPLVVISIDALRGDARWAIPPGKPGAVLRALGVRTIVLHRDRFSPSALALFDPVLRKSCGPPIRDLAGDIDLCPLAKGTQAPVKAVPLYEASGKLPPGWRTLTAYLERLGRAR